MTAAAAGSMCSWLIVHGNRLFVLKSIVIHSLNASLCFCSPISFFFSSAGRTRLDNVIVFSLLIDTLGGRPAMPYDKKPDGDLFGPITASIPSQAQ